MKILKITLILLSLSVIGLLGITNFTIINELLPDVGRMDYASDKGNYRAHEVYTTRAFSFESVMINFEAYKKEQNKPDLILHRRFERNWRYWWDWYDYLSHPRWKLPYAERDEDT